MTIEKRYYRIREAADALGITPEEVKHGIATSQIKADMKAWASWTGKFGYWNLHSEEAWGVFMGDMPNGWEYGSDRGSLLFTGKEDDIVISANEIERLQGVAPKTILTEAPEAIHIALRAYDEIWHELPDDMKLPTKEEIHQYLESSLKVEGKDLREAIRLIIRPDDESLRRGGTSKTRASSWTNKSNRHKQS